jgi:hypothetical protein
MYSIGMRDNLFQSLKKNFSDLLKKYFVKIKGGIKDEIKND